MNRHHLLAHLNGMALLVLAACQSTHTAPDLSHRLTPNTSFSSLVFSPAVFHDVAREDVMDRVVPRAAELRYCYDSEAQRDRTIGSGEVVVHVDIAATGAVRMVEVEDHGVDADVALCLARRFRKMQFPPTEHLSSRVTLGIQLSRARTLGV